LLLTGFSKSKQALEVPAGTSTADNTAAKTTATTTAGAAANNTKTTAAANTTAAPIGRVANRASIFEVKEETTPLAVKEKEPAVVATIPTKQVSGLTERSAGLSQLKAKFENQ